MIKLNEVKKKKIIMLFFKKSNKVFEGSKHIYIVFDYLSGGEFEKKLKKKIIYTE